jgi:ferrous iron transport protein B
MYLIGFTVAPLVAWLLKLTLLRGGTPIFVMELPAYKRPTVATVAWRTINAGWAFLKRAGTLILASMILVWACLYFPDHDAAGRSYPDQIAAAEPEQANRLMAEWKQQSVLGQVGQRLEPVFRPLGWDWKIGMAVLSSFPAREVIVGTLGILYQQGELEVDDSANRSRLGEAIREDWQTDPIRGRYGVPVALSIMVFFALCMQCASTLAVIAKETRSWSWPLFTFVYMTTLAYVGAFVTYQLGRLLFDAVGATG